MRRRLTQLTAVSMDLLGATTVEDLSDVLFDLGLAALGADGGGIVMNEGGSVGLVASDRVRGKTRAVVCSAKICAVSAAWAAAAPSPRLAASDPMPRQAPAERTRSKPAPGR